MGDVKGQDVWQERGIDCGRKCGRSRWGDSHVLLQKVPMPRLPCAYKVCAACPLPSTRPCTASLITLPCNPSLVTPLQIGLIQFCISPPKSDLENNVVVSDYTQVWRKCWVGVAQVLGECGVSICACALAHQSAPRPLITFLLITGYLCWSLVICMLAHKQTVLQERMQTHSHPLLT